jgi:cardiolipin synthase
MTPYFLPEDRLVTALILASLRGVGVDIVLPERSNHRLVDWATRAHVSPLLRSGCRIWLNPPPFDHSKAMVVDGAWCLIGSSNWDMRSFRLNFELNMEIYDDEVAREVGREITKRQGRRLLRAELERRSFPVRLRDAGVRLLLPYL